MVVDESHKLIYIDILLVLFGAVACMSIGWFGHYVFDQKNYSPDECLSELKESKMMIVDCMEMIQRSDHLLSSLKIHVQTCQSGYEYLEGIARTCLTNDEDFSAEHKTEFENPPKEDIMEDGDSEDGELEGSSL